MAVFDRRLSKRIRCKGRLTYVHAPAHAGDATLVDVSYGGLHMRLGRYLRPGANVMVAITVPGAAIPVEFKAQVAWCTPTHANFEFDAGLRIYHDEPDSEQDIVQIMCRLPVAGEESWQANSH